MIDSSGPAIESMAIAVAYQNIFFDSLGKKYFDHSPYLPSGGTVLLGKIAVNYSFVARLSLDDFALSLQTTVLAEGEDWIEFFRK